MRSALQRLGVAAALVAFPVLVSFRSACAAPPGSQPALHTYDVSGRSNANALDMFVTNLGSFGTDFTTGSAGLYFPTGSPKTVMYGAGLWVGALVAGNPRVTVAEYSPEYVPGAMASGTYQPDIPTFKVYTIVRGDTTSPDYQSWCCGAARSQGAPLDASGKPLLLGDRTLWSIYNDADPSKHTNQAGKTLPLNVQVSQLTYSYAAATGALANTIFLKFTITNGGSETIPSAYFSLWSDPDLGGARDDLVGCDTTLAMGYTYNATNADAVYGSAPPAMGFMLLEGPIAGSRFHGLTAFDKYINGTDPYSASESYNYMRGLDAPGGTIFDPITGLATTYVHTGDPVAGTGWLDTNPSDRRMLLTSGPCTMAPGDSQVVLAAIIAAQGTDRLQSITLLRQYAAEIRSFVESANHPPQLSAIEPRSVDEGHALTFSLDGGDPDGNPLAYGASALPPGAALDGRTFTWTPVTGQAGEYAVSFTATDPFGAADSESVTITVTHPTSAEGGAGPTAGPTAVLLRPSVTSGHVTVDLSLTDAARVEVTVFDETGSRICDLANTIYSAGPHSIGWDLRDGSGDVVPSGVYVVRVAAPGMTRSMRVCVLR